MKLNPGRESQNLSGNFEMVLSFFASNLKQLQLAWQLYADDHNGRLVPNWTIGPGDWSVFSQWRRGGRAPGSLSEFGVCARK
jgi:hypothetical protein